MLIKSFSALLNAFKTYYHLDEFRPGGHSVLLGAMERSHSAKYHKIVIQSFWIFKLKPIFHKRDLFIRGQYKWKCTKEVCLHF